MAGGGALATPHIESYRQYLDPRRQWYNNKRIITLNAWLFLALVTSSYNGFDGSLMNGLQTMDTWKGFFNNPQGGRLGILNAIQNIGSLASFPFAPYLADGIGRRYCIIIGAILVIAATAIQTAAQDFGQFVGARFLIGFGISIAQTASPMLVTELAYPPHRAPLTSLYNSLWYSGAIVAAWSTFGTAFMKNSSWSWRIPSVLQALPAFFQVVLFWFGPESPRWLVAKGRNEEALRTLAYYHADGDSSDPLVQYEYEEIKAAIDLDVTVAKNVGWKSLFTTRGNLKRLRIIVAIAWFSQWSGNGLVSYYLTIILDNIGITSSTIKLLINGILQIWNLAWAVFASFLVERVGRRILFITSCVGMLIFFSLQTACSATFAIHGSQGAAHATLAFIFLFYAAYDLAFTPLIVSYTVEILPYNIRAKGLTVFNFTVSVALVFNQQVNPIALDAITWKYYILYCCWIAFELVYVYLFVLETKGLSLEETAALFDGNTEQIAEATAHAHPSQIPYGSDVKSDDLSDKA